MASVIVLRSSPANAEIEVGEWNTRCLIELKLGVSPSAMSDPVLHTTNHSEGSAGVVCRINACVSTITALLAAAISPEPSVAVTPGSDRNRHKE